MRKTPTRTTPLAAKIRGFDPATSVLEPKLGSATTKVYKNADGTYTAHIYQPAVTNPTGTRTTSDSTYVRSDVTRNFSDDNALYVGAHEGRRYNSFVKFDGFKDQFTNAYVVGAKLYLDTEFSGAGEVVTCEANAVTVAPITAGWNPRTLNTFPGPKTSAPIGSASWSAGINCPNGRQWGAVPLNPRALTNWAHGWAANQGFAITAPYKEAAWKQFNPDNPYLAIEYTAFGAGAAYAETLYAAPWNNKTGWAKVTIQNEGSATWTPTNGYKLGYQIYTVVNGVRKPVAVPPVLTPMPKTVEPNRSVNVTATLPALTPGPKYEVCWDMVLNGQYFSGLGVPAACYALDVVNNAPVIDSLLPYNNSTQFTLTPTLSMVAHDPDNFPGTGLKYTFNVFANGSTTPLATSGSTTSPSWVVPAGKLAWGSTYFWTAQVTDGNKASQWSQPGFFTTPGPAQPLITSHLGEAPRDATVHGVSPNVGNYSTAVVDASIPGMPTGPQPEIRRTYNSLDPRLANAFGAGWSSLIDTRVVPDADGSGSVVVVLPDGREERFGRNGDGSFTSPPGVRDKLTARTYTRPDGSTGVDYFLTDSAGLRYNFTVNAADPVTGQAVVRISEVRDQDGHEVEMTYNTVTLPQPSGGTRDFWLPADVYRRPSEDNWQPEWATGLTLTWGAGQVTTITGKTIMVPHVTDVQIAKPTLDAPRIWTYGYDAANNLTTVCPPPAGAACTRYGYTAGPVSGSHFAAMVIDSNPKAYWRLTDPAGSGSAEDSIAVNMGMLDGRPTDVAFGQPGALAGSPATSATFNGASSRLALPDNLIVGNNLAVGMWFKTTQSGGTLFSYQSKPAGTTVTADYTPALYVGTDGKLRGQFRDGTISPMVSPKPVNDGRWHHVVLSGASNAQTLYLDGEQAATRTGANIAVTNQPYVTVGAGQLSGTWPAVPAGNPLGFFAGQIADVSFATRPLGLPSVQQEFTAGVVAARELTSTIWPSGKDAEAVTYDVLTDRVTTLTTPGGGVYRLGAPTTTGSTAYYRGAVLSTRPTLDYPMDEPSGTIARNQLGLNPPGDDPLDGVYNNIVLGVPGIFGADGDTAAAFDGRSSYLSLPEGAIDDRTGNASAALWFRTTTAGGVLLSYQSGPIGTVPPGPYVPALYIGSDGKLRGQFWDGTVSPMVSQKPVNDGNWHLVVIAAGGTTQSLWLDGQSQATRAGQSIAERAGSLGLKTVTVGAGYIAGAWPTPQTGNPHGYFSGQLAHAALYAVNVVSVTPDAAGLLYRAKGSSTAPTPTTTVTLTDPDGHMSTVAMDPTNGYRTIAITDELGKTTSYTYDTLGFEIAVTDPNGHTTTRIRDKYGNVIQRTTCQTTSSCQTSYYSYFQNATDPTDPLNGKVQYAADPRSGTTGTANPAYRTTYTYSPTGHVTSLTAAPTPDFPNGRKTTYAYTTVTTPAYSATPDSAGHTPAGLLASVTDPRGQVTAYRYYENGQLATVTEPSGQVTTYEYDGYRKTMTKATITSDSYPDGLSTFYQYDDLNRLTTQRFPTTTDAVTGRMHTPYLRVAYDADGNVTSKSVEDWGRVLVELLEDPPGSGQLHWVAHPAPGQSGLDETRTETHTYDAANRPSRITGPDGTATSYEYDLLGRTTGQANPDGARYRYAFSATGQHITTTLQGWIGDPTAPSPPVDLVLESRAYDPAGRLASVTDAVGRTTAYAYFDDGLLQSATLAAGTPLALKGAIYTYDAAGNLIEECTNWTADKGCARTARHTVDAANRITKTIMDPAGANVTLTRTFDADDNVLNETLASTPPRSTTYGYDAAGRLTSVAVANGATNLTTKMTYDQRGLLMSMTDPRGTLPGATAAAYTTTYGYDEAGRRVTTVSPKANVESDGGAPRQAVATSLVGYNTFGEPVELDDPNGNILTSTYDRGGRPVALSYPAYTAPGSTTTVTPTIRYAYDPSGRLVKTTDPLGHDETVVYDQLGRPVKTTKPAGRVYRTSYDAVGEVLSMTDPTGARTESTYNVLSQPVTSTQIVRGDDPQAYTTTFGYNEAGQQTTVTDPLGNVNTAAYNALGQATRSTDPLGNETRYEYNAAGQPVKITAADGTAVVAGYDQAGRLTSRSNVGPTGATLRTTSYGYDAAGNLISATDPLGRTITVSYDALNRISGQTQPSGAAQPIASSFGYDAAGNRTRYTDPNGNATTYTYNSLGLRESKVAPSVAGMTAPADRTEWTRYDAGGRPTSVTQPGNVTITMEYDAAGRIITQSGSGAEAVTATRTFGYDTNGRLTSASAPTGTETFTYDDRGLLLTSSMPGWNSTFSYDGNGRMASRTDPSGSTEFRYDKAGRLTSQSGPITGVTVGTSYNAVGLRTGTTYGTGGTTRTFSYDTLHQLTSDVLKNPAGATQSSITYGYDGAGRLTSKKTTGTTGSGDNTYGYDTTGRLISWNNGTTQTGYAYDPAGNRTQAGGTSYTYNARSQVVSATDGTDTASYSYTKRGTTASITSGASTTQVTSDAFNQQISAGTGRYTYDALGRMVTAKTGAGNYTFGYDDLTNNTVSDGSQTFGRTPTGQLLSVRGDGATSFAMTDRHGDVTATFTATGPNPTSSATYDPYGRVTASGGSRPHLGYQGGWTDASTGFVNAAARWYNPGTGTFTSADTQENPPIPAVNANPYAYGNDDPLDNSDPTGHDVCSAWSRARAEEDAARARSEALVTYYYLLGIARQWASIQRDMALTRIYQMQGARAQAARQAALRTESAAFRARVDQAYWDIVNRRVGSSYASSNFHDTSANDAFDLRNYDWQHSGLSSGNRDSRRGPYLWEEILVGGLAAVVVGAAVGPIALGVGAGGAGGGAAASAALIRAGLALAAAYPMACTAANAPPKPQEKPRERPRGPVAPTGDTRHAPQLVTDPGPDPRPAEAPETGDESRSSPYGAVGKEQGQLDDACFTGRWQRPGGATTAGVWNDACGDPATARGYSPADVDRVEQHLARPELDPLAANDVMIDRIRQAVMGGHPLSEGQTNFMRHELFEADLMDQGWCYKCAHRAALRTHPPGRNYDPDVVDQFEEFGPWWRRMNGLEPR